MEKTHWKKAMGSNYIGSWDIDQGKDLTVQIMNVAKQLVKGTDGKEDECIVATLKDQKPMILNSTNCKTIATLLETPYLEEWKGKSITLYVQQVKAFGEVVDALRVRAGKPALPELTPTHPGWDKAVEYYRTNQNLKGVLLKMRISKENEALLIEQSL